MLKLAIPLKMCLVGPLPSLDRETRDRYEHRHHKYGREIELAVKSL